MPLPFMSTTYVTEQHNAWNEFISTGKGSPGLSDLAQGCNSRRLWRFLDREKLSTEATPSIALTVTTLLRVLSTIDWQLSDVLQTEFKRGEGVGGHWNLEHFEGRTTMDCINCSWFFLGPFTSDSLYVVSNNTDKFMRKNLIVAYMRTGRKICPAPRLHKVRDNLILTAIHWTKMSGPRLKAE